MSLCPNCLKDYKDVKENDDKGGFTQQNNHYYEPYRTFGYACPHCGFHSTVLSIPTLMPFVRSSRTHPKLDKIVAEFQQKVIEYYDSKKNPGQLSFMDDD